MTDVAPVFESTVVPGSERYLRNLQQQGELIERMRAALARTAELSNASKPRFDKRGQLLPRERLARLLDPGSPFLEIGNMAGFLVDSDDPERSVPGAAYICGIGFINGTRCMVTVDDSGINAGAMTQTSTRKAIRVMDIALEQKLPFVQGQRQGLPGGPGAAQGRNRRGCRRRAPGGRQHACHGVRPGGIPGRG